MHLQAEIAALARTLALLQGNLAHHSPESQADLSRTVIAGTALPFITDGVTILVHGYSNVVMYILEGAARQVMTSF